MILRPMVNRDYYFVRRSGGGLVAARAIRFADGIGHLYEVCEAAAVPWCREYYAEWQEVFRDLEAAGYTCEVSAALRAGAITEEEANVLIRSVS